LAVDIDEDKCFSISKLLQAQAQFKSAHVR